jgi:hypothetical protein
MRRSLLVNVWYCIDSREGTSTPDMGQRSVEQTGVGSLGLRLGIDVACRAAHQANLADEQGKFLWSGRKFRTTPSDLRRL